MVNCAWCTCCIDRQFMQLEAWNGFVMGSHWTWFKVILGWAKRRLPKQQRVRVQHVAIALGWAKSQLHISSWSLADNWDMSAQVNALTNPPRHWKWFSPRIQQEPTEPAGRTQQEPTQWLWWSLMLNGGQLGQSNITYDICFGYLYNWWRSYCRNLISVALGIVIFTNSSFR